MAKTLPFPPRNGIELPLARFFEEIGQSNQVDFLVINESKAGFEERVAFLPPQIGNVFYLKPVLRSGLNRLVGELMGVQPAFFAYKYDEQQLRALVKDFKYDIVWVNPPGSYTFLEACENIGCKFYDRSVLGLNDLITSIYAKHLTEMWHRRIFDWRFLSFWFRSFFIAKLERKYLYYFDFVHLQTQKEADKAIRLLKDPSFLKRIIVSPNGKNESFLQITSSEKQYKGILYMTHLDGDRSGESTWFIQKVWPKVKESTDAELWLVGTPPTEVIHGIHNDPRVKILGFVDDLKEIYSKARIGVVPIFHNCGLINRIQDALSAGLPIVTTQIAASTFKNLQEKREVLASDDPLVFAKKTIELYQNQSLRKILSEAGRAYSFTLPNWKQSAKNIIEKLENKFITHGN